jgi:hypothetical protein
MLISDLLCHGICLTETKICQRRVINRKTVFYPFGLSMTNDDYFHDPNLVLRKI